MNIQIGDLLEEYNEKTINLFIVLNINHETRHCVFYELLHNKVINVDPAFYFWESDKFWKRNIVK